MILSHNIPLDFDYFENMIIQFENDFQTLENYAQNFNLFVCMYVCI